MLSVVDSFIEYLHSELGNDPPVHWVRNSKRKPSDHLFKHEALNVMVLGVVQEGSLEHVLVSLDIVAEDTRRAYEWADAVTDALDQTEFTPELNYSPNPAAPTTTGKVVSWDVDDIDWELISARPWRKNEPTGAEGSYVQLNTTIPLTHARR